MPPINWEAVEIKKLDELLDKEEDSDSSPEPEW